MIKVTLIGTGNVSRHLFPALMDAPGIDLLQVAGRNREAREFFKKQVPVTSLKALSPDSDIYILAISDDSLYVVSESFKFKDKLVLHTSGAVAMEALSPKNRRGVLYPLQTFSKGRTVDFLQVPLFIEAETGKDLAVIRQLAEGLSARVIPLDSEKRKKLHLAAVFANNFTNYLYGIAWELAAETGLSPSVLLPLIRETASKLENLTPEDAQTGPARRGDRSTLDAHVQLLARREHQELYTQLSNAILQTYAQKL